MEIVRWLVSLGSGILIGLLSTEKKKARKIGYWASVSMLLIGAVYYCFLITRPMPPLPVVPYSHLSVHCAVGRSGTPDEFFAVSDWSLHLYAQHNLAYGPFTPTLLDSPRDPSKLPASSVATCVVNNDYPVPVFGFVGSFAYKLLPAHGSSFFGNMVTSREPVFIDKRITDSEPGRFEIANALSGGRRLLIAPTLDCAVSPPGSTGVIPCVLPGSAWVSRALPGLVEFPVNLSDKNGI
jgi:hypothetical protein